MDYSWRAEADSNDDLVNQLKRYGIVKSARVEAALRAVDRGQYSNPDAKDLAYKDMPHSIGYGATISAPHMHAYCLERLLPRLKPGASVLDVGSGSGYLTACFAHLVGPTGRVLGIDIIPELVKFATANVARANPEMRDRITFAAGDGWKSLEGYWFDAIHVGAAASDLPDALVALLKPGGEIIIPIGTKYQSLYSFIRPDTPTGDTAAAAAQECKSSGAARGEESVAAAGSATTRAKPSELIRTHLLDVQYVPLVKGKNENVVPPPPVSAAAAAAPAPKPVAQPNAQPNAAAGSQPSA